MEAVIFTKNVGICRFWVIFTVFFSENAERPAKESDFSF